LARWGTVEGTRFCVWQNFLVSTRSYLPCPGGGWEPLTPDTVTARRKMPPVAGIELALVRTATDALVRLATPSPNFNIALISTEEGYFISHSIFFI